MGSPERIVFEDLDSWQGKTVRVKQHGATLVEGVIVGAGQGVMAVSKDEVSRTWSVLTKDRELVEFAPPGYSIEELPTTA